MVFKDLMCYATIVKLAEQIGITTIEHLMMFAQDKQVNDEYMILLALMDEIKEIKKYKGE